MRSLKILVVFLLLFFHSAPAICAPLRIWIIPYERDETEKPITKGDVKAFISNLEKEKGIIIENQPQDLLLSSHQELAPAFGQFVTKQKVIFGALSDFRKKNGEWEPIEIEFMRWSNVYNRLSAAKSSNSIDKLPDVVQMPSTWTAAFAKAGAIEDLSRMMKIDEDEYFKPVMASAKPIGLNGIYGIPWLVETRIIYYRKDLFDNPQETFKDWKSFLNSAEKISQGDKKIDSVFAIQIGDSANLLHNLSPWIWSAGGDILKPRTLFGMPLHSVELDNDRSIEAMDYLLELSRRGIAGFYTSNTENLGDLLIKKKYAAVMFDTWFIERLRKQDPNWHRSIGISPLPAGRNGSNSFIGGTHLSIWHGAKKRGNLDKAAKLVQQLTSPSFMKDYVAATSSLPAHKFRSNDFFNKQGLAILKKTIEDGKTYPPLSDWGGIVENQFIHEHISQIWRDIAQAKQPSQLHATIKSVAKSLRRRIAFRAVRRASPFAGVFLILSFASLYALVIRSRIQCKGLCDQLFKKSQELNRLRGSKKILEATRAAVLRLDKNQRDKLDSIQNKIDKLSEQEKRIDTDLSKISPPPDSLSIHWDGTIAIDDKKIKFENQNQTSALFEYLVREAQNGIKTMHCLVGFPLFGWDQTKLKTHPRRLFQTLVSKVNSQLRKHGLPTVLAQEGRNSWRWTLCWDPKILAEKSIIGKAHREVSIISELPDGPEKYERCIKVLHDDPKCIGAYALLSTHPNPSQLLSRISFGIKIMDAEIKKWNEGLSIAQKFLEVTDSDSQLLKPEFTKIKHRFESVGNIIQAVLHEQPQSLLSPQITRIIDIIETIHHTVKLGKVQNMDDATIWSEIVQKDEFECLLSQPIINSIMNSTYNPDLQTNEDPRLIQLAMIKAYSKEENLRGIREMQNEGTLSKEMRRQIGRELQELQQELASMPEY